MIYIHRNMGPSLFVYFEQSFNLILEASLCLRVKSICIYKRSKLEIFHQFRKDLTLKQRAKTKLGVAYYSKLF